MFPVLTVTLYHRSDVDERSPVPAEPFLARGVRCRPGPLAAAGLHRLPCARQQARASLRGVFRGDRFHRASDLRPPRRAAACRYSGPSDTGGPLLSAAAIASPPAYDRARAVARYSGTMRDLIQSFKYRDRQEGLGLFGWWLARGGPNSWKTPI